MEELRLAFLVIGACAIGGILIHGLWSVRKNSKGEQTYQAKNDWDGGSPESEDSTVIDGDIQIDLDDPLLNDNEPTIGQYDDLGLGEVRVVSQSASEGLDADEAVDVIQDTPEHSEDVTDSDDKPEEEETRKPRIYASVVSNPKPEYAAEQEAALKRAPVEPAATDEPIPEPPASLLRKEDQQVAEASSENRQEPTLGIEDETPDVAVKRKKAEATAKKRKEPRIREDQMRIDFDEPEAAPETPAPSAPDAPKNDAPSQEVLVINVKAPDDAPIQGAALLPMLLTLGFKFGDQDIFHRHVNSNGKGPVLFSLANMFKPGVFDIDNLENFSTQGVSLFMILPIEGDPHQVFNMMHNAARKIADEFSSQVLDGRRSALTKQSLQQYVEKIREFERMRMIAR